MLVRLKLSCQRHHKRESQHDVIGCCASRSQLRYPARHTTADRTAAHRKSDRCRDDLCAVGLHRRAVFTGGVMQVPQLLSDRTPVAAGEVGYLANAQVYALVVLLFSVSIRTLRADL